MHVKLETAQYIIVVNWWQFLKHIAIVTLSLLMTKGNGCMMVTRLYFLIYIVIGTGKYKIKNIFFITY